MTKRTLAKFLERAQSNRKISARKAYSKKFEEIRSSALEKYGLVQVAADMEVNLNKALDVYKKWADANDGKHGIRIKDTYYDQLPARLYDYTKAEGACYQKLLETKQVTIETTQMIKEKKAYQKELEDIAANFNTVIATVEGMSAKDGADYLKELGFDISELETQPTVKVLAKRVESRFLLVSEPKAA